MNSGEQIQTPITAAQGATRWVLEIEMSLKCETRFPAGRVRCRVIDRWKRVQGAILSFTAGPLHDFRDGSRGNTPASAH
jgi:hypothetical protein